MFAGPLCSFLNVFIAGFLCAHARTGSANSSEGKCIVSTPQKETWTGVQTPWKELG